MLAFFDLCDDGEWKVSHPVGGSFDVRDVLAKANLGKRDSIEVVLPIHACKVYILEAIASK